LKCFSDNGLLYIEKWYSELYNSIAPFEGVKVEDVELEDLQGFTRLEILEFTNNQIKRFITNWFGPYDKVKANVLLNLLMNNKDLEAFAKNPLMISIIAVLIKTDYELLYKRSDLYKRMIDIILGEWDAQKKIRNHFSLRTKKLILRKIASRNHSRQRRTMTEKEILEEIERHSFWIGYEKEKSRLLLEEISQRSYILRQLFKDTYDFLHIFFQEYFTALELIEQEDGNHKYGNGIKSCGQFARNNPYYEEQGG